MNISGLDLYDHDLLIMLQLIRVEVARVEFQIRQQGGYRFALEIHLAYLISARVSKKIVYLYVQPNFKRVSQRSEVMRKIEYPSQKIIIKLIFRFI